MQLITLNKPIPELGQYTYRTQEKSKIFYCRTSRIRLEKGLLVVLLLSPSHASLDDDGSSPFWICSTVVCLCKSPRFSNSFPQVEHFNFERLLEESELVDVIFLDPYDGIVNKNLSRAIYKGYMNGITTTSLS